MENQAAPQQRADPAGLKVRRPGFDEAEAMARLHIACWREAYAGIVPADVLAAADLAERTRRWRVSLHDPDCFALADYDGDRPVAFILALPNRDPAITDADGQVAALYVLQSHYRLKLGTALLAAAARWWHDRGGRALGLGVLARNTRAMVFYQRMGGRIAKTGTFMWSGHALPDAIFVFDHLEDLAARAKANSPSG